MASVAKAGWDLTAKVRLDELERVYRDARGLGAGRRWGTEQLNRSLFVVLVAQFQTYCRDLHDEAVDVHVAQANPRQALVLRNLLTQGRQLDNKNPRAGALGSDFGRLGIELVPKLKAVSQPLADAIDGLEVLVDFRNAVAHGNESELAAVVASGHIKASMTSFRIHRRTVTRLVGTMDHVVSTELARGLHIAPPW
jgi:hypothetical protein